MFRRNGLVFHKTWVWNPAGHLLWVHLPLFALAILATLSPLWAKHGGYQPQFQPQISPNQFRRAGRNPAFKPGMRRTGAKKAPLASSQDWKDPAYWGLKKGEYIPDPGCMVWWHKHKKGAEEFCADVHFLLDEPQNSR